MPNEPGFWFRWVLVSTVGVISGWVIGIGFLATLGFVVFALAHAAPDAWLTPVLAAAAVLGSGGLWGSAVGASQGWLLRKTVSASRWLLASLGGGMLGGILGTLTGYYLGELVLNTILTYAVGTSLLGAVIGAAQWFTMRHRVSRSGWWIVASMMAYLMGGLIVSMIVDSISRGWGDMVVIVILMLAVAVMFGAITGGMWVWLLRQPPPKPDRPASIAQ